MKKEEKNQLIDVPEIIKEHGYGGKTKEVKVKKVSQHEERGKIVKGGKDDNLWLQPKFHK